ncbi:MAG: hypothetical protein IJW46_02975, partial [Clostridia bacterium]|nr:hypothetical protein [Clostridia bacterium]
MTENIHESLKEQPIPSFMSMPKEELETLAKEMALHMSVRDLTYCQNQYRLRERRDPSAEELALLDTLWVRRTDKIEHYGLRTFYTSDPLIAETYADLINKASHLRRENRPYTPNELSGVLTHTLAQAGKKPSVPTLCTGEDAALRLLADGHVGCESAVMTNIPALIGHPIPRKKMSGKLPQTSDQLLLILPNGLTPTAFASAVAALPLPESVKIVAIGSQGLFEALLTWDGVYVVQAYLPGVSENAPLSSLV